MLPYIILGVILGIIILWFISVQRRLAMLDENINNAMSHIGVQLSSRWDALSALLDLTKGYAAVSYTHLMCDGSLALAFRRKPSGATSIRTFLSVPGEEGRREIGDLFDLRGLNHNQWAEIYGYVPLLPLDDPAFEQIGDVYKRQHLPLWL